MAEQIQIAKMTIKPTVTNKFTGNLRKNGENNRYRVGSVAANLLRGN